MGRLQNQGETMALLPILTYPDSRLREVSTSVEVFDSGLEGFVSDMLETMKNANGIGLAAPQVGVLKRILVIDIVRPQSPEDEAEAEDLTPLEKKIQFPLILINPVVKKGEGKTTYEEGCLSVPGYYEEVQRFNLVDVEAQNLRGEKFSFTTDGLLSICIQHEMDHLEGKLFIDRLSFVKSNKIKNRIKKVGYPTKKGVGTEDEEASESNAAHLKSSRSRSKLEV